MKKYYFLLALFCFTKLTFSQNTGEKIVTSFDDFIKIPEEAVYLHLNKSILLQGEDLGFAAYVYDIKEQKPFLDVKNLYCQLLDEQGKVVKEKLILLERGKSNNVFSLDSITPPGKYSIRAFTNWMKNFKSPHYFQAPILILDENGKNINPAVSTPAGIDVYPEGGHLIKDVLATITFKLAENVLKNKEFVTILKDGTPVDKVAVDLQGIGRFSLIPEINSFYEILIDENLKTVPLLMPSIEEKGIALTLKQVKDKVLLQLRTNEITLESYGGEELFIIVNGSKKINAYPLKIENLNENIAIKSSDVTSGVNQVTLMDAAKRVIATRLFFNYEGFSLEKSESIVMRKELDSIKTQLTFDNLKNAQISISVLPAGSSAIDPSLSIASSFKLNPYLYDNVFRPMYYFNDVTNRKKLEMDNLMICLGWEMYDWDFIFEDRKVFNHDFESGITVKAAVNQSKNKDFMVLVSENSNATTITLEDDESSFVVNEFYPFNGEPLRISELNKKGVASKAAMYLRFYPSAVPAFSFEDKQDFLALPIEVEMPAGKSIISKDVQLDAIVLKYDAVERRNRKLQNRALGRLKIFTDEDRAREVDIFQYLRRNGVDSRIVEGQFKLIPFSKARLDPKYDVDILYDGIIVRDPNFLIGLYMGSVDSIELDFSGMPRPPGVGKGGVIVIKTDPTLVPPDTATKVFSSYDVPLTFSTPSKFYRPTYYSYNDDFFEKYGVIDWQGDVEVVDGKAVFSMPYLGIDKLLLHIQGWTPDGTLIDEIKEVTIETSAPKF